MAVMRLVPAPTPSPTPVGVFVHVAQITNFVMTAGTWPIYDITSETLTDTVFTPQMPPSPTPIAVPQTSQTANTQIPPEQSQEQTSVQESQVTQEEQNQSESKSLFDAILVGGLDYRQGDLKIHEQEKLFKKGFGENTNVKSFTYNTFTTTIKQFLSQNPKIPIFLFSAGCSKTLDLANDPNVDKNVLFVIEPYSVSPNTKNLIEKAMDGGLPAKNVYVGSYPGVGSNLKGNTSKNPAGIGGELGSHWGALEYVGSQQSGLVKNRVSTPTQTNVVTTPTPTVTPTPIVTPTPAPTPSRPTFIPVVPIDELTGG